jgi:hypothetical protein
MYGYTTLEELNKKYPLSSKVRIGVETYTKHPILIRPDSETVDVVIIFCNEEDLIVLNELFDGNPPVWIHEVKNLVESEKKDSFYSTFDPILIASNTHMITYMLS